MKERKIFFTDKQKREIVVDYLINNMTYKDIQVKYNYKWIKAQTFATLSAKMMNEISLMDEIKAKYFSENRKFKIGIKTEPYFENEFEYGAYPLHKLEHLIEEVYGND